jgi:hypothetical protein
MLSVAPSTGSVWEKRQAEEKADMQLPGTKLQNSSDELIMLLTLSMPHFLSSHKSYLDDDSDDTGGGGYYAVVSQDTTISIVTRLQAGQSRVQFPARARDFCVL